MVFANPTYLWALLGLLVPLAIHLWSKKEAKTIKIGSVQLLDESNSRQSSSIQLNEWLLLLLRMLILALIVLLMAGPQWRTKGNQQQVTYFVEPSLANEPTLTTILDSLQEDESVRLFANGFPEWDLDADYRAEHETPNYWQLAQRLDSLRSDSLVVFTKALSKGFRSKRPNTAKKIHWIVFEQEEFVKNNVVATKNKEDVFLISTVGNGMVTQLQKQKVGQGYTISASGDSLVLPDEYRTIVPMLEQPSLAINLYAEEDFKREVQYIKASLKALSIYLNWEISIREIESISNVGNVDMNIFLGQEPRYPLEGKWLVFNQSTLAKSLIEPSAHKNLFYLTARLDTKRTVEEHFTEQLLNILDLDHYFAQRITALDNRQLDESQFAPNYKAPIHKKEKAMLVDVSHWLFWLLVGLICLERALSKIKKQ